MNTYPIATELLRKKYIKTSMISPIEKKSMLSVQLFIFICLLIHLLLTNYINFTRSILNKHPGAIELLKKKGIEDLNSPQFRAYAIKVTHAFDMVINMVEEPLVLEEMIELIAEDFGQKVGIKKSYFEVSYHIFVPFNA